MDWMKLIGKIAVILFLGVALSLSGCGQSSAPTETKSGLDGQLNSSALAIFPILKTVVVNGSLQLDAEGGERPYLFSIVNGGGSIDPSSGLFTASAAAGDVVIRVTDSRAQAADAAVKVVATVEISPSSKNISASEIFAFSASNGIPPYTFSLVTDTAGGSTIDATKGVFTASASEGMSIVKVTDAAGDMSFATVRIGEENSNEPNVQTSPVEKNVSIYPVFDTTTAALADATEGVPYLAIVSATDPENRPINYSVISGSLPSGPELGSITGAITGMPGQLAAPTPYAFKVQASNGTNAVAKTFAIKVSAVNDTPVPGTQISSSGLEDAAQRITLTGSDAEGQPLTYSTESCLAPIHAYEYWANACENVWVQAFNAEDGGLVTSFGQDHGDGRGQMVKMDWLTGVPRSFHVRLAVQADGRVIVGANDNTSTRSFAVARFLVTEGHDGELDGNFGTGGKSLVSPSRAAWFGAMTLRSDGEILMSGISGHNGERGNPLATVLFDTNGHLDTSFGNVLVSGALSGEFRGLKFLSLPATAREQDEVRSIAMAEDNKFTIAGFLDIRNCPNPPTPGVFCPLLPGVFLSAYKADGTLDTSFATGGVAYKIFRTQNNVRHVVLPNKNIAVMGTFFTGTASPYTPTDFNLLVFDRVANNWDPRFESDDGGTTVDIANGSNYSKEIFAIPESGKIVIVGTTETSEGKVVSMARFWP